jgi:hypothetical protein
MAAAQGALLDGLQLLPGIKEADLAAVLQCSSQQRVRLEAVHAMAEASPWAAFAADLERTLALQLKCAANVAGQLQQQLTQLNEYSNEAVRKIARGMLLWGDLESFHSRQMRWLPHMQQLMEQQREVKAWLDARGDLFRGYLSALDSIISGLVERSLLHAPLAKRLLASTDGIKASIREINCLCSKAERLLPTFKDSCTVLALFVDIGRHGESSTLLRSAAESIQGLAARGQQQLQAANTLGRQWDAVGAAYPGTPYWCQRQWARAAMLEKQHEINYEWQQQQERVSMLYQQLAKVHTAAARYAAVLQRQKLGKTPICIAINKVVKAAVELQESVCLGGADGPVALQQINAAYYIISTRLELARQLDERLTSQGYGRYTTV